METCHFEVNIEHVKQNSNVNSMSLNLDLVLIFNFFSKEALFQFSFLIMIVE